MSKVIVTNNNYLNSSGFEASQPLTIDMVDHFDALQDEWRCLLENSSTTTGIFSTWDWQHIWWQSFCDGKSLHLLAVRDNASLIGVWPLYRVANTVALIGGADVCDYLDVISQRGREEEVLATGFLRLQEIGVREIDLRFLPSTSLTVVHLTEIARSRGWISEQSVDDVCPAIDLPTDWDSYLASLTKKDRHELRRKLRRLDDAGTVEREIKTGHAVQQDDVDDFLYLHRLSRPEKAAFMDDVMENFFRSILAQFLPREMIRIYFLSINGRRVAATLCIDHSSELWVYNSGFDRSFAPHSVGLAAKAYCIQDAISNRKQRIDFLRGPEPYKYDLGAHDNPAYRLRTFRQ